MKIDSLEVLFREELRDIYDAEKRLTKALPKMAKAAKSAELKTCIQEHLQVTKGQVGRIEQIFEHLGSKVSGKTCKAMLGLLEEGEESMEATGTEPFTDIGIICSARRIEHYEMAAYLSLQAMSQHLETEEITELIEANLAEEQEADEKLAEVAVQLMAGSGGEEEEDEDMEEDEEGEEEEEEVEEEPVAVAAGKKRAK